MAKATTYGKPLSCGFQYHVSNQAGHSRITSSRRKRNGKSNLARPERFELPTYSSGGCRSIQLSYGRAVPSLHPCKAFCADDTDTVRADPLTCLNAQSPASRGRASCFLACSLLWLLCPACRCALLRRSTLLLTRLLEFGEFLKLFGSENGSDLG